MLLTDPVPFTEASELVRNKLPVTRDLFDQAFPELQAASFVITGVEDLHAIERVRNLVAGIPEGEDWDEAKGKIIDELEPWLDDVDAAERRAELLLRSHGFAAYATMNYRMLEEEKDIFTWRKYQTAQDERVRGTHAALDGIILPASSPFWRDHTPPWDFGCRCDVIGMTDEDVDEVRFQLAKKTSIANTELLIIEPGSPELDGLEQGFLSRDNQVHFVARDPDNYIYDPEAPMITTEMLEGLKGRVGPRIWSGFVRWAKSADIPGNGNVWDWLEGEWSKPAPKPPRVPRALALHRRHHPPVKDVFRDPVGATGLYVEQAGEAIESVHGDGILPPLSLNGPNLPDASGYFDRSSHLPNPKINVRANGPWPKLTAVHEVGHALDYHAFGDGKNPGTETLPEFDRWYQAAMNSQAVRTIGILNLTTDDRIYYRSKKELWARSYAQWIAQRSGDQELLQGVSDTLSSHFPQRQWDDADFAPIADAMDEIFTNRNWLRP